MSALSRIFSSSSAFSWASMLVEALAWPAAAVAIAAVLRSEVRLVVGRLARLKYRDFEAQFRVELGRVERLDEAAPGAPPTPAMAKRLLDLPNETRRVLHELSPPTLTAGARPTARGPRAVIASAWAELAASADRAAGVADLDPAPELAARGLLGGAGLLAFERIQRLHDAFQAEPGWEPSEEVACRFAGAARKLAEKLATA